MRFPRVNSQSAKEYPSVDRNVSSGTWKHWSTSSGFGAGVKVSGTTATTGRTLTCPFERNGGNDARTLASVRRRPTSSDASRVAASTSPSFGSFFPPGRHTSPAWVLSDAARVQSSTWTRPSGPRESGTSTDARREESGGGSSRPLEVSRAHHRVSASHASSIGSVDELPFDSGRV